MKIKAITLWQTWPAINRFAAISTPGDVRYAVKKSRRLLEPHWQDILTYIKDDLEQRKWTPGPTGLPVASDPFWKRLEADVLQKEIEIELYQFPEHRMADVDGLSANDEENLSLLFLEEAKPDAEKAE